MAVEESIKIKIQANAEEFKIVAGIINTELGKLGKNFEILEGNIKQTSNAMKGFDGSSKKFNKGITSISLILQDLPYGFRGIQNNIPALAQGFGVLYLAISAVTAAMTYFVLQGDNMSKDTKKIYEAFKEFINGVVNQVYNTLKPAFDSIVKSIMFLWDMFGNNLINQFKYIWENLLAFVKIAGNILAEAFNLVTSVIKGDWSKFGESLLNIFKYAWNGIIQFLSFALKMVGNGIGAFTRIFDKDLGDAITKSTEYTANKFADEFKFAFKEVEKASKKIDIFSLFGGKKKGGNATKEDKPTVSKAYENLAEEEFNFYKDSIFRAEEYFVKLNNIRKVNALMEATIRGASADELFAIQQTYEQKELNFRKSIEDKKIAIRQQSDESQIQLTKANDEIRLKALKELTDRSVYFTEQRIKAVNTEADASIKANRGNFQAQKQALEEAIVKLAVFRMAGLGGAEAMLKLDEAIGNNKAKIEGLIDPLETLNQSLQTTFNQLNIDLLTNFADQMGAIFAGGKFDFKQLGNILADGLSSIGKALIAFALTNGAAMNLFKDPKTWPLALAAGIAAVAAGSFLRNSMNENKATAFANGGIVSGPTMGLVGEYPGAANNPEVIAPLDKLKSMIGGGGGGTFVLRGQDLLVSINRTQKSSSLKGQNISLA